MLEVRKSVLVKVAHRSSVPFSTGFERTDVVGCEGDDDARGGTVGRPGCGAHAG